MTSHAQNELSAALVNPKAVRSHVLDITDTVRCTVQDYIRQCVVSVPSSDIFSLPLATWMSFCESLKSHVVDSVDLR